jgi:hypothetical protein
MVPRNTARELRRARFTAKENSSFYGRASEADDQIRNSCQEGWWRARPLGAASVFSLHIEQATFISWDTEHGEMTVRRWSPQRGYTEARRSYP